MPAPPAFAYNNPQEAWFWNGLPLQSPVGAWNISTVGGARFALPTFRGQNYTVPYRMGQSQRGKLPDSRTVTLTMWTDGQGQQSGLVFPSPDQRLAFNNNLQQLRASFIAMGASFSQQGLLQRNWYLTQSGINQLVTATAMAELAGSMDLTMNGRTNAAFSVDFLLADPAFYGANQSQAIATAGGNINHLGDLVAGLGYPSAVSAFTVQITAACTVSNVTAGVSFTFTPNGSPSYPVTVDILNQTVTDNAGTNWGAGLSHLGGRSWMVLVAGLNAITNTAGTATFQWNPAYS